MNGRATQDYFFFTTAFDDIPIAGQGPDFRTRQRAAGVPWMRMKSTGPPGLSSSKTPIVNRPVRQASVSRLVRPS
jgi:hypothetical protein